MAPSSLGHPCGVFVRMFIPVNEHFDFRLISVNLEVLSPPTGRFCGQNNVLKEGKSIKDMQTWRHFPLLYCFGLEIAWKYEQWMQLKA